MIRWPDRPTSSNADSTFRIGRKKADEDQLQPTVWNTLRKLSRADEEKLPDGRPSAWWHQSESLLHKDDLTSNHV
ncbi:hypothetical protein DPX16_19406 [Anabarilius grahami]|uniref:Uncharacterized protein n=1 Tax=Anabarilius grahami TaxID=495550 RepID=A0A3N0Z004_ANAGA|nr:hypothetical protein DPX16_19406 [Anabarilius grahami]